MSIHFVGSAHSFFLPVWIDYDFRITYNADSDSGMLAGTHDGYPSYIVQKGAAVIYEFQQGVLPELAGSSDVSVSMRF